MLIDPQTGRKIQQNGKLHQLHDYFMLDNSGTGLFHASFYPEHLGEHQHCPHQITVLLKESSVTISWQSNFGRNYQQSVRVGQCYVVPSQQTHGLTIEQESELISFYLAPDFISRVLPESDQGRSLKLNSLQVLEDTFIQQLATTIQTARLLQGSADKLLVESAMNVLAFYLVNQYAGTTINKPKHTGKLSASHLARVKEFVATESANSNIAIADIAKITGYSTVHFSRMFKRTTGQSPYQYLTHYRITHAKRLLQNTTLSIAEVAYQVGFGSHAHFSTQFRHLVGVSPQNYRTQVMGDRQYSH